MTAVDVIIDTREGDIPFFVEKFVEAGIKPRVEKLDAGDFLIYGKVRDEAYLCEHKVDSDLLGSIEGNKNADGSWTEGRIWDQLARMKESGVSNLYVIVEGNPFSSRLTAYRKKGFTKQRIWGAYAGIAKFGVQIFHTKNKEETAEWLIFIAKKLGRPRKEFALRTSPPHTMSLVEKRLYLLQSLPGIGPVASKEIMKRFRTPKNFFENLDKIDGVPGIGTKTKKEITKIYG